MILRGSASLNFAHYETLLSHLHLGQICPLLLSSPYPQAQNHVLMLNKLGWGRDSNEETVTEAIKDREWPGFGDWLNCNRMPVKERQQLDFFEGWWRFHLKDSRTTWKSVLEGWYWAACSWWYCIDIQLLKKTTISAGRPLGFPLFPWGWPPCLTTRGSSSSGGSDIALGKGMDLKITCWIRK